MTAIGLAKQQKVLLDTATEEQLVKMVAQGEIKDTEADWQPLFHPDPVHTKGYALWAFAAEDLSANEHSDAWVHHLAAIQAKNGQ